MDIEISPHAADSMEKHNISIDEIKSALVDGETEFEIYVEGEKRHGNTLLQKTRKLIVIWARRNDKIRVITCYLMKRKI
ncbi:MAG: DUF4258 domain-containing protein [Candidatus Aenigmarchaeota archaeon]|nr:DUF4258 domain-containing protein [Candidatus Aenigmarchaeota archaeon]MDI6722583.1 DUF4258 domain-containing protein [Candidatus Aenigmarchaeota archaeon]